MSLLPVGFGGTASYDIAKSVRFRSSASAYLSRTPGVAGNRRTWTWSGWVKRGALGGPAAALFSSFTGSNDAQYFRISFGIGASDDLYISAYNTPTASLVPVAAYRDPAAWYHIVFAFDTTQATASNRMKLFVNGVQITAFSSVNYPAQNFEGAINAAGEHRIGSISGSGYFFDGHMAEINFIDGQALDAPSFGQFDANGVWQPKKYAGTYGINGFYLPFSNGTSLTTLCADASGNGNNFTASGVSLTAGVNYDWMDDTPTNNFAVLNPLDYFVSSGATPIGANNTKDGNLFLPFTGGTYYSGFKASIPVTSGKWYVESVLSTGGSGGGGSFGCVITNSTTLVVDSVLSLSSYSVGTVLAISIDCNAGTGNKYVNNISAGTFSFTAGSEINFALIVGNCPAAHINFGQRPFVYTPPTGFKALSTKNLPAATIENPRLHFDVKTWVASGTVPISITGVGFKPDLVWQKSRSAAYNHHWQDSVRGGLQTLISNQTGAEITLPDSLTSFNADGFTLGLGSNGNYPGTGGTTHVGWLWKAGGAAVTNTSGSISSQVSANTAAGFSVVTYTGTGANATVGHGLGVVPKMVIIKGRSAATTWPVYHHSIGVNGVVYLETTAAQTSEPTRFNSTLPSSTVLTLGTFSQVNFSAVSYVAYCFAEVPGFSKIGSYTGNGSTDGPFVYCGFRPRWVLYKRTDASADWYLFDAARLGYNGADAAVYPNLLNAESSAISRIDFLANGFKIRTSSADPGQNASGGTYIFMAFAETPFQTSRAR